MFLFFSKLLFIFLRIIIPRPLIYKKYKLIFLKIMPRQASERSSWSNKDKK